MVAIVRSCEAHAAVGGLGVAHDVSYSFADGETEDGLFGCVELWDGGFAGQGYACGLQGVAGLLHLGGESTGAIAADGFTDFGESGARRSFDVGHLLGCALRIEFDEAAGELGF
ncbi:hypothetical protein RBB78_04015 [Tunturiibacter empetritectus]|uniref:hypothetical protein n=1 Tax=Tunturiibacter empetritectus TaxID=3069691 RepID=UPI003D9B9825